MKLINRRNRGSKISQHCPLPRHAREKECECLTQDLCTVSTTSENFPNIFVMQLMQSNISGNSSKHFFYLNNQIIFLTCWANFGIGRHPILHSLIKKFENFHEIYRGINENFRKELIFENKNIPRVQNGNRLIDRQFFSNENWNTLEPVIGGMTYDNFVSNGRLKSLAEINANHGIDLSSISYMRLGEVLMSYKRRLFQFFLTK